MSAPQPPPSPPGKPSARRAITPPKPLEPRGVAASGRAGAFGPAPAASTRDGFRTAPLTGGSMVGFGFVRGGLDARADLPGRPPPATPRDIMAPLTITTNSRGASVADGSAGEAIPPRSPTNRHAGALRSALLRVDDPVVEAATRATPAAPPPFRSSYLVSNPTTTGPDGRALGGVPASTTAWATTPPPRTTGGMSPLTMEAAARHPRYAGMAGSHELPSTSTTVMPQHGLTPPPPSTATGMSGRPAYSFLAAQQQHLHSALGAAPPATTTSTPAVRGSPARLPLPDGMGAGVRSMPATPLLPVAARPMAASPMPAGSHPAPQLPSTATTRSGRVASPSARVRDAGGGARAPGAHASPPPTGVALVSAPSMRPAMWDVATGAAPAPAAGMASSVAREQAAPILSAPPPPPTASCAPVSPTSKPSASSSITAPQPPTTPIAAAASSSTTVSPVPPSPADSGGAAGQPSPGGTLPAALGIDVAGLVGALEHRLLAGLQADAASLASSHPVPPHVWMVPQERAAGMVHDTLTALQQAWGHHVSMIQAAMAEAQKAAVRAAHSSTELQLVEWQRKAELAGLRVVELETALATVTGEAEAKALEWGEEKAKLMREAEAGFSQLTANITDKAQEVIKHLRSELAAAVARADEAQAKTAKEVQAAIAATEAAREESNQRMVQSYEHTIATLRSQAEAQAVSTARSMDELQRQVLDRLRTLDADRRTFESRMEAASQAAIRAVQEELAESRKEATELRARVKQLEASMEQDVALRCKAFESKLRAKISGTLADARKRHNGVGDGSGGGGSMVAGGTASLPIEPAEMEPSAAAASLSPSLQSSPVGVGSVAAPSSTPPSILPFTLTPPAATTPLPYMASSNGGGSSLSASAAAAIAAATAAAMAVVNSKHAPAGTARPASQPPASITPAPIKSATGGSTARPRPAASGVGAVNGTAAGSSSRSGGSVAVADRVREGGTGRRASTDTADDPLSTVLAMMTPEERSLWESIQRMPQ